MKLYGIANCTTVRKARDWLAGNGIEADFHDFKKLGVTESQLASWIEQTGWEKLVNRNGPTWRQLPDEVKAGVTDAASAIALMREKTSAIKRPVLEKDGKVYLGFDQAVYQSLFGKN